jgi:hypothetical protein
MAFPYVGTLIFNNDKRHTQKSQGPGSNFPTLLQVSRRAACGNKKPGWYPGFRLT